MEMWRRLGWGGCPRSFGYGALYGCGQLTMGEGTIVVRLETYPQAAESSIEMVHWAHHRCRWGAGGAVAAICAPLRRKPWPSPSGQNCLATASPPNPNEPSRFNNTGTQKAGACGKRWLFQQGLQKTMFLCDNYGFPRIFIEHHETHLPALQDQTRPYPWLSRSHEDPRWSCCDQRTPRQRPQAPGCLSPHSVVVCRTRSCRALFAALGQ